MNKVGFARSLGGALAVAATLAAATGTAAADGRSGTLDLRYGANRTGIASIGSARDVLYGRNGDALVLDGATVRRLTPSGRFDGAFGAGGAAPLPGRALADIHSVRTRDGGAVYAAASSGVFPPEAIVVTKIAADGSPVTSFGGDGSVDYPPTFFAFNEIRTAAVTRAGRVFVAGNTGGGTATLRRIEPNGSLGGTGACTGVPGFQTIDGERIEASASDGERVLLTGFGFDTTIFTSGVRIHIVDGCGRTLLSRLVTRPPGDFFSPQSAVRTPSGWLLATPEELLLVDDDGDPVTTFGNGGFLPATSFGVVNLRRPAVDEDGQIVTGGNRLGDFASVLVRLTPAGALDTTFGEQGMAPVAAPAGVTPFLGWVGTTDDAVLTASAGFDASFNLVAWASRYRA